jgi:hypothetical protein
VNIEALRELVFLLAADSRPDGGPMLQAQYDSSLSKGVDDANFPELAPDVLPCLVSVEPGKAALGRADVGSAAADDALLARMLNEHAERPLASLLTQEARDE